MRFVHHPAKAKATCPFCHGAFAVVNVAREYAISRQRHAVKTWRGELNDHGPRTNRCPGSRWPVGHPRPSKELN